MIFRNQARGTEDKGKKEFVNVCCTGPVWLIVHVLLTTTQDLLRSDFHKRFMVGDPSPRSFMKL